MLVFVPPGATGPQKHTRDLSNICTQFSSSPCRWSIPRVLLSASLFPQSPIRGPGSSATAYLPAVPNTHSCSCSHCLLCHLGPFLPSLLGKFLFCLKSASCLGQTFNKLHLTPLVMREFREREGGLPVSSLPLTGQDYSVPAGIVCWKNQ